MVSPVCGRSALWKEGLFHHDLGAFTGQSSHGATKSVHGVDPDGTEFEIMWMVPREEWGEYADAGVVEFLDLDAEVARWSGVRTAGPGLAEAAVPAGRGG